MRLFFVVLSLVIAILGATGLYAYSNSHDLVDLILGGLLFVGGLRLLWKSVQYPNPN